jgi:transposase
MCGRLLAIPAHSLGRQTEGGPGVAQGVLSPVGLGQQLMGRGLIVPEVAGLLECNEFTARGAVHRLATGGFNALADTPRPGRSASVTREDREALAARARLGDLRLYGWTHTGV